MKKGRHRRFEEARALKRSHDVDIHEIFEDISDTGEGEHKPEHDAWADLAEEWDSKAESTADTEEDVSEEDVSEAVDDEAE